LQGVLANFQHVEGQLCGKALPPLTFWTRAILPVFYSLAWNPTRLSAPKPPSGNFTVPTAFSPSDFPAGKPLRWDNRKYGSILADSVEAMRKRTSIGLAAVVVVLGSAVFFGYRKWSAPNGSRREEMLALMPADASAVFFADFGSLRQAPILAQLHAWAPKPQAEADYAQFVKETGFDFERDLERIAIAVEKRGQNYTLFAILDGNFDRQKISAYALKDGSITRTGEREIFCVPVSGTPGKISFAFLKDGQIALTNDSNLALFLDAKKRPDDVAEWRARFERLAGSAVFAVVRQDAALGSALSAQAPGGYRSPQLSALLDQLQWVTLAGKPENDRLRIVAEGECTAEATARQLADVLNGVVILAESGLNDARTRRGLDPAMREAYLELLKGADVSKLDRGDTKSVRLILEITPNLLEAVLASARGSSPARTARPKL